ncbi:40S ribosomal protein S16 [Fusarium oxysporum f. sp. albedinis]|nr:40S ribosomal protein S16 [Fusarium oxysporum f. sp. albedinis]
MIAGICQELAMWCADSVCGVDGKPLSDLCLRRRGICSKFLFCHCDLYSVNIIVNTPDSSLGLIDWETADFLIREWIRTKFRVSGGLDLPGYDHDSR